MLAARSDADLKSSTPGGPLMRRLVLHLMLLTPLGCTQLDDQTRTNRARFQWDVSQYRSAAAFPWYDFDPNYGAIDQAAHLEFKFDRDREFKGDVELITFSRAHGSAPALEQFRINLPPQTAQDTIQTLRKLATAWRLDTTRLDRDAKKILSGPDYRGIILADDKSPAIEVALFHSFHDRRPYSITITWYWDEAPVRRE